jgi:nitrite reductase/ring-hydroxylating ferredoxin subunit
MTYAIPPALRRFAEFLAANPSPAEVVEGQFYWVPCATLKGERWRYNVRCRHIPLLGPVHEDQAIIGFQLWHIHADTRFLTVTNDSHFLNDQRLLGAPLCLQEPNYLAGFNEHFRDTLIPSRWVNADLSVRKLRARRSEPVEWPERHFQRELEDAYADASAACGICPHKQIPLFAGRDMGNGVRQCPGHGLCWDREGRMVREQVTP